MGKDISGSSTMRRGRRVQEQKPTAKEIVRGVRRGDRNAFHQGSPEGIAYAFTEQLQRHAGGRGPFAHVARRALDSHDPQPADDMPPVPKVKPLASQQLSGGNEGMLRGTASPGTSAYWEERGWHGHHGPLRVPVVNISDARDQVIRDNRPAVFEIASNPTASNVEPWHFDHSEGDSAVRENDSIIQAVAADTNVDANLIRAIIYIYVENSQGHYFGAAQAAEWLGVADTLFPMNINPEIWGDLLSEPHDYSQAEWNIRLGAELLKRIGDRIVDPSPEKIGSIWNFSGRELTSDFGARVQLAYDQRPWERTNAPEEP